MLSIGVDIGKFSVKVALVEGTGRGFRVVGLDEIPLGQDPAKDQTFDILEALREIKKRYGQDGAPLVIGARQNHLSLRRKSFPFKERHKILKSLPFELEDEVPMSQENAIFDAKVTHTSDGNTHVIAMVCPKVHIEQLLRQVGDADIDPQILSAEAIGISNLFEDWRDAPVDIPGSTEPLPEGAPADLILHIGHSETIGVVIRDGYMLDSIVLDWGGKDIADLIALKYSIHYIEALKELRKKGFILLTTEGASREQLALSDVIKSALSDFSNSLRLSILELQTLHAIRIQKATLRGGVAGLRNLGAYLTQKLEVPVNRLQSLPLLPETDFTANPRNELAHIVSIGLAVEGLRRPKNPAVNFLKGEFARQSENLRLFWDRWSPSINLVAGCFLIFFLWAFFRESFSIDMLSSANAKLKDHAKNVAGLSGKQASNRNISKFIRDQEQKIRQREVFDSLKSISSALDILNRVSIAAPAKAAGNLNVTQFYVSNSELRIAGYADKQEVVSQLQNALKGIAADANVQTQGGPENIPSGQKGFEFKVKLDRRSGG